MRDGPQHTMCHNLHGPQTGKCLAFSKIEVIDPDLALRRADREATLGRIRGPGGCPPRNKKGSRGMRIGEK